VTDLFSLYAALGVDVQRESDPEPAPDPEPVVTDFGNGHRNPGPTKDPEAEHADFLSGLINNVNSRPGGQF
jgi:hypothetical protein